MRPPGIRLLNQTNSEIKFAALKIPVVVSLGNATYWGIFMHANMKKSDEAIFEIRKLKACSPNGFYAQMSYEEHFMKYAGRGDLRSLSKEFSKRISLHLSEKNIPFKLFDKAKSEVDGVVRLKGPARLTDIALAQIRKEIAIDGADHRRYRYLEIEQIGPGEGERRVFGTKGPPRSESVPSKTAIAKEPFFDADGEDADTYYPFLLSNLLDDPEPEVRLQFTEFGIIDETLGGEFEMEGNTLGCVMDDAIRKKKLVKDHAGTHPGGYFDNSEGSTVLFHFNSLNDAIRVAEYFTKVFTNKRMLKALFKSSGVEL